METGSVQSDPQSQEKYRIAGTVLCKYRFPKCAAKGCLTVMASYTVTW